MDKFWDLFRESVILQGVVTVMLLGVACYLWAVQQPVPDALLHLLELVVGFWLGSKVQQALRIRS